MPNSMRIHSAIPDFLLGDREVEEEEEEKEEEKDGQTDATKPVDKFLQHLLQACWNINITN
jgi:hypothetical protein